MESDPVDRCRRLRYSSLPGVGRRRSNQGMGRMSSEEIGASVGMGTGMGSGTFGAGDSRSGRRGIAGLRAAGFARFGAAFFLGAAFFFAAVFLPADALRLGAALRAILFLVVFFLPALLGAFFLGAAFFRAFAIADPP